MSLFDTLEEEVAAPPTAPSVQHDLFGGEVKAPKRGRPPGSGQRPVPVILPSPSRPPVPPLPQVLEPQPAFGAVTPQYTAFGAPFPPNLRAQQVGLRVIRTVIDRIDEALSGGPIKLVDTVLGDTGKTLVRAVILVQMFPELFGDPIPQKVKSLDVISSRKALKLISDRIEGLFSDGRLEVGGLRLSSPDVCELMTLLREHVVREYGATV